jgi:hypothetical protein
MMIRRATFHRYAAWLALTAMTLIMVMPALSRSMAADKAMSGMEGGCLMHADHQPRPGVPSYPDEPTAKCGYCTLLDHTPVVGKGVAFLHLPAVRPAPPLGAVVSPVTSLERFLSARPRGPPSHMDA